MNIVTGFTDFGLRDKARIWPSQGQNLALNALHVLNWPSKLDAREMVSPVFLNLPPRRQPGNGQRSTARRRSRPAARPRLVPASQNNCARHVRKPLRFNGGPRLSQPAPPPPASRQPLWGLYTQTRDDSGHPTRHYIARTTRLILTPSTPTPPNWVND